MSSNHDSVLLLDLHASWQSQVLKLFQMAKWVGAFFISMGKMFHTIGATAEKALFLEPASQKKLIDGVHNTYNLNLGDGVDKIGVRQFLK